MAKGRQTGAKAALFKGVAALAVATAIAGGVCCLGYAARDDKGTWFGNFQNISEWHWADKKSETTLPSDKEPVDKEPEGGGTPNIPVSGEKVSAGGSVISNIESNGIKLASAVLPESSYKEFNVPRTADSAYTLTFTVEPEGATDLFKWTVTGNEDEGITIESSENQATVICNKAFGVTKVIKVSSTSNPDIAATCAVNYYKRLQSVSVDAPSTIKLSTTRTTYGVSLVPHYSEGSVLDTEVKISALTIETIGAFRAQIATWSGMEANFQAIVDGDAANSSLSLIMSPDQQSSFYNKVKGADCSELYAAYFKKFVNWCKPEAEEYCIRVHWYAVRNGGTFDSGEADLTGDFDVSDLIVPATNGSLSDTSILF